MASKMKRIEYTSVFLYQKAFVTELTGLLNDGFCCDCHLFAEGKSVNAHRVILSAASPYFKNIFQQAKNQLFLSLTFETVSHESLVNLVSFIYKGKASIHPNKLNAFAQTLKFFQISASSYQITHALSNTDQASMATVKHSDALELKISHEQENAARNLREEAINSKESDIRPSRRVKEKSKVDAVDKSVLQLPCKSSKKPPFLRSTASMTYLNREFATPEAPKSRVKNFFSSDISKSTTLAPSTSGDQSVAGGTDLNLIQGSSRQAANILKSDLKSTAKAPLSVRILKRRFSVRNLDEERSSQELKENFKIGPSNQVNSAKGLNILKPSKIGIFEKEASMENLNSNSLVGPSTPKAFRSVKKSPKRKSVLTKPELQCTFCKKFCKPNSVVQNQKACDLNLARQTFPCPQCSSVLSRKSNLYRHLRNSHKTG